MTLVVSFNLSYLYSEQRISLNWTSWAGISAITWSKDVIFFVEETYLVPVFIW